MEPDAKYTLIGTSILVLVVAIASFFLWKANRGDSANQTLYSIYFKNQTLDGLQIDSYVTMKGIKVGSVSSLKIEDRNIEEVRVVIAVSNTSPVKTDTRAVINRNLLTGLASIDLVGGTQQSPALVADEDGDPYPTIQEGRSAIDQVASNIPAVMRQIGDLAERAELLLSDDNLKLVNSTLVHVDQTTANMAEGSEDLRKFLRELSAIGKEIAKVSDSISKFSNTGNEQLTTLGNELDEGLTKLNAILGKVDEVAGELAFSVNGSARLMVQQLEWMAQNIEKLSKSVSTSAEEFRDVGKIIRGPHPEELGPGESRQ
ncbi:MAG: MCE family protein [Deltaproteobacteria bacterium]|nr:MCE family protein [Deltaproteobacteria bacterium]